MKVSIHAFFPLLLSGGQAKPDSCPTLIVLSDTEVTRLAEKILWEGKNCEDGNTAPLERQLNHVRQQTVRVTGLRSNLTAFLLANLTIMNIKQLISKTDSFQDSNPKKI